MTARTYPCEFHSSNRTWKPEVLYVSR